MAEINSACISVLIVDDVAEVRQALRTALTLAGNIFIAGDAPNGLEALRLVESLRPAVVLMDLEMPVMDGYEAARRIKASSTSCRVVALTVHGYDSARRQALQSGADEFVVKGAPLESLLRAIQNISSQNDLPDNSQYHDFMT